MIGLQRMQENHFHSLFLEWPSHRRPTCTEGRGPFHGIVPIEAALGSGGTQVPIAGKESAVAKQRADVPAVNNLRPGGRQLVHFVVALLQAQQDGALVLERQRRSIKPNRKESQNGNTTGVLLPTIR